MHLNINAFYMHSINISAFPFISRFPHRRACTAQSNELRAFAFFTTTFPSRIWSSGWRLTPGRRYALYVDDIPRTKYRKSSFLREDVTFLNLSSSLERRIIFAIYLKQFVRLVKIYKSLFETCTNVFWFQRNRLHKNRNSFTKKVVTLQHLYANFAEIGWINSNWMLQK